ncbi:MAG TPA: 2'-5' RNA ligase family protein [Stellaceae bacterium]|jgi:2'-5' RNA ligase|nr:2'-5' RNA ligase family protein [Stellaceae bacterium]
MPFALTLGLDATSASAVEAMWQALHEKSVDSDRHQLGYPPHVTLAVCPDTARRERLDTVISLARAWSALPVTLSGIGIFASSVSILWVAPAVTAELLDRHRAVLGMIDGEDIDPYYRKDVWVPHITLAETLTDPAPALTAILPLWRPVSGFLDRIELIRFRPVEVLWSLVLKPPGS